MNTEQIDLIRVSFAQLATNADAVGLAFYDNLFRTNPAARSLFRQDIAAQSRKLMAMLGAVVVALDAPWKLDIMVRELGERHGRYGVADAHYDDVGAALIQTLRQACGADFTAELEEAWGLTYAFLAERMIAAVRAASAASAA